MIISKNISNNKKVTAKIDVVQFCRRPFRGYYSVERTAEDIRANVPPDINMTVHINKYLSKGIFKRLINAFIAARYQKEVNHVASDIHYVTLFLKRKHTILTINDCVSLMRKRDIKFWLIWFFWYWLPEKRSSIIVTISEESKRQVLSFLNCDPEKIRVIYCNVSDEFIAMPKKFDVKSPRILHIGTSDNKNLERHIAAVIQIPCTLIIIGHLSEEQLHLLEQSGVEYENFKDLSRDEMLEQYVSCDLLLFASLYEGFGLPIVEAQAVGRPVVTSNTSSMPEVAGDAALMVNPNSVESIKSGIKAVIESEQLRQNLVNNGYENCKRFSSRLIGSEFGKVYREIYNQNS